MEKAHLKSFVKVAELGNVTRAAEQLNSTPPSISTHIKLLEENLNAQLFHRSSRGMTLTDAGRELLEPARTILNSMQAMQHRAAQLGQQPHGVLRIGLNGDPGRLRVAQATRLLSEKNPNIQPHYRASISIEIIAALKTGELDAGFIFGECPHELKGLFLQECPLVVIGPLAWQTKLRDAKLQDLAQFPWIGWHTYCPLDARIEALLPGLNLVRNVLSSDQTTRLNLVQAGLGLSLLEAEVAQRHSATVFVSQLITTPIQLNWVYHRQQAQNPVIEAMTGVIRQLWHGQE